MYVQKSSELFGDTIFRASHLKTIKLLRIMKKTSATVKHSEPVGDDEKTIDARMLRVR